MARPREGCLAATLLANSYRYHGDHRLRQTQLARHLSIDTPQLSSPMCCYASVPVHVMPRRQCCPEHHKAELGRAKTRNDVQAT